MVTSNFQIFFVVSAVFIACIAAQCPANDGSWIPLTANLLDDSPGIITMDDMGFTGNLVWSSNSPPILIYNSNGFEVSVGGTSGVVLSGTSSFSSSAIWDGQDYWKQDSTKPGYYYVATSITEDKYGAMNFSTPISVFSATINADPNSLSYARIEAFDADGNRVGCVDNMVSTEGINGRAYRGIRTSTPMVRLVIYGFVALDDIRFAPPECSSDSCDINAWCFTDIKYNANITCACKSGFEGNGTVGNCIDKNECKDSPCAANASCTNLPGSYNCTCNEGFEGDGLDECADINECDAGLCSVNATCVNYEGGFNCTCLEGYTGDGLTCADLNECQDQPCDPNATCTNTEGAYSCACNIDYSGDGKTCTKTVVPSVKQVSSAARLSTALIGSLIVVLLSAVG